MKVVIQRVAKASVTINNEIHAAIAQGLLVLLGICDEDNEEDVNYLVKKIAQLRVFSDEQGKMNCSVTEVNGEILVVSQFTLFADTKKGNRPSFIKAALPEKAIPLYQLFIQEISKEIPCVKSGVFAANMKVDLLNDGPVTIIIDSKNK